MPPIGSNATLRRVRSTKGALRWRVRNVLMARRIVTQNGITGEIGSSFRRTALGWAPPVATAAACRASAGINVLPELSRTTPLRWP